MAILTSIEICAGAGGQALGLEMAGFEHVALVEIDKNACETLRKNRPAWNVIEGDVRDFSAADMHGIDLFAGGVPCPPFSIAGKQQGKDDERDLFPDAIRLISECRPKAILLENVKGFLSKKFEVYREGLNKRLKDLGYTGEWKILTSSDFGVPQLRPRAIFVGFQGDYFDYFEWPRKQSSIRTVGEVLFEEMAALGWEEAENWKKNANGIAPTLVGGSKRHGGADLGPTRARQAWAKLGVDGRGVADAPPSSEFQGMPRLTVKMAGLIQGFPHEWNFHGKKTPAYRQVGNAFPPPVAKAVGEKIGQALKKEERKWQKGKVLELNFGNTS